VSALVVVWRNIDGLVRIASENGLFVQGHPSMSTALLLSAYACLALAGAGTIEKNRHGHLSPQVILGRHSE
jgi:hypothetical protein